MGFEALLLELVAGSGLKAQSRVQHPASVGYRIVDDAGNDVGVMEIRGDEVEFVDLRYMPQQDTYQDVTVSLCEPGSVEVIGEFLTRWRR